MSKIRKGFEITPSVKRDIIDLAKRVSCLANGFGCGLDWDRQCGIQWSGSGSACKGEDASNIIHDIAHYSVASPAARKCFDFGLGPSPSTEEAYRFILDKQRLYSLNKCSAIEKRASALGIYWERALGLPWEKTAEYHSWHGIADRIGEDGIPEDLAKSWKDLASIIKKVGVMV